MTNPKKSKAFIITFVLVILLLLIGYWLFSNKDKIFKTEGLNIGRIFEPLLTSKDRQNIGVITDPNIPETKMPYSNRIIVQAKESINNGNLVYLAGVGTNGVPIIANYDPNNASLSGIIPFGVANQNINAGGSGEILITEIVFSQALEDIEKNSRVYLAGATGNGVPIIANYDPNNASLSGIIPFGVANQNINAGEKGGIIVNYDLTSGKNKGIWKAISGMVDNVTDVFGNIIDSVFNNKREIENSYNSEYDSANNVYGFPVVSITASPTSVKIGGSSIISWTSTNALSCSAGNNSQEGTSGSFSTGPLEKSTSFTVSCTGEKGTVSNSIIIQAGDRKIDPFKFPIVSASANPSPINPGETSTISWTSLNTNSCDSGIGNPTTTSGSFSTGILNNSRAYTIICTGDDGVSSRNAFVIIKGSSDTTPNAGMNNVCSNGSDDDKDGKVDSADPQCHLGGDLSKEYISTHFSESVNAGTNNCDNGAINYPACDDFSSGFSVCNDKIDNDGDKLADNQDPECHSDGDINNADSYVSTWTSESFRPGPACNNKGDDDKDEKIDIADPECHSDGNANNADSYRSNHFSESVSPSKISQCADGVDNDKKEGIDAADPSCHTDFNASNSSSYDKNITNESREKTFAQCGDGKDNDGNNDIDYKDPQCHTDENVNNWESYYPDIYSERGGIPLPNKCNNGATNYPTCDIFEENKELCDNGAINYPDCTKCSNGETNPPTCTATNVEINKCQWLDQYPLDFTDSEKAKLAELLRKFYLIAPTLKTEDDLNLIYNEIDKYQNLITQVNTLTKQCYQETNKETLWDDFCLRNSALCENKSKIIVENEVVKSIFNREYRGPTTIHGNPWYKELERGSYFDPNNPIQYTKGTNMDEIRNNYYMKLINYNNDGSVNGVYDPVKDGRISPFTVNNPSQRETGETRASSIIWNLWDGFDKNQVIKKNIEEFELLLNVW